MHKTDTENICNADGCNRGHCISAIHYNGSLYYHNSQNIIFNTECDKNDINIPCTFIQQDWINDIYNANEFLKTNNYKDVKNACLYSLIRKI